MQKVWKDIILVSSLIGFTACGGGGGAISGQLSGPAGSNLSQTEVAAFACKNDCQVQTDVSDTVAAQTVVTATGSQANYQLANVPGGKYLIVAAQDTNGSGKLDAGDLIGAVKGVPSPSSSVNIQLQLATAAGSAPFNPAAVVRQLVER